MKGLRRSSRLSSLNNQSSPSSTLPNNKTWQRRQRNGYVESDNNASSQSESENNENCNLLNSIKKKTGRDTREFQMNTPKSVKTLRPMPASKKQELLNKRKVAQEKEKFMDDAPNCDSDGVNTSSNYESPPKQKRIEKHITGNVISPSRLMDRLSIDDKEVDDESCTVSQKRSIENKPAKRNKYQNARRVLNTAETDLLPGREQELVELQNFFNEHLNNSRPGSLYVSGQPGTGKTACLSKLIKSTEFSKKFIKVYINCTSISTIGSIYKKICAEMQLKAQGCTEKDCLSTIKQYLCLQHQNRKMILMVLDEIDQLCGQKQSVLYTIFEWPSLPGSRLLLVGIANSLDLTDRMLMRLNSKCELKPRLMHFAPYTKQQLVEIFKSRLEQAGVQDVFPPMTIQLLAAKVSAVSGDVRRALDIGRRVVELAEQRRQDCKTNEKPELKLEELEKDLESEEVVQPVAVTEVLNVLNNVYGTSQCLQEDIEGAFPLQQKIMICCLMLMLRKEKNKDITLARLYDVYKRVCNKRNIHAVDQAEFNSLVELVETRGILRIVRKKEPRLGKVQLQWDEEEVNAALCDKQLIASILDDTSCLNR